MDIISLALSKKYTNLIGSGISSITAVGNNIHFVTTSLTEFDITLPYSVHEHTNLDTILEKLTLDGNGNLLFDGNAISSGSTINYLDLINKPTINGVEITGSKSLSDLGVQPTIVSGTTSQYYRGDKTFQTLDKTTVGLGNVDNTSDVNKPISTSTQTALNLKADTSTVTTSLASKVDKETGKSLIAGSVLATLNNHTTSTSNPHSVTKTQVGLGNVDNISDVNKPISTATQTALNLKADTSSISTSLGNKVDKVVGSSLVADTTLTSLNTHKNSTSNPHSTTLSQLADVNIVNLTEGQEIAYDMTSSKWINIDASNEPDERVKATSSSVSSKYLNELIDNSTIVMVGDQLIVKSVEGVTIAELKTLIGMDSNIKATLNTLSSAGMTFKGVKNTKAELNAIVGMLTGELYIVKVDESQSNLKTSYIYDGTSWISLGESSVSVRDFTVDKIDLTSEVKNILPKANMDLTGIATTIDLADYTTATDLSTNYALKSDLTAKANASDIYTKIESDTNFVAKVVNKSLVLDTEIAKIHTHANKTVLDNATASYTTAEQTKLSNILGTNTGDETSTTIINKIGSPKLFHGIESRSVGATNPLPTHITTSTFTLSTGINPIVYYYRGSKITVSVDKTVVLGASGLYYISFINNTGNIQASTSPTGLLYTSDVIIATVMWNGTNYGLVNDERHSYDRDTKWHLWAHRTVGTRYSSGITLTHNGGTGASATFATTSGDIYDEDIQFVVDAQTSCRTLYETSVSAYTFDSVLSTAPFKLGIGGRPVMVRDTDYSLITLTSATNRYINVFVYATTDLLNPIYMITETVSATVSGTNGYTSLALARVSPFPNMSNKGISEELRPLYRLIIRADGQVRAIDTTQDDYRTVSSLPMGAGTTSPTASATNFTASGNISATTVQGALEELDSEKVDKVAGKSLILDTEITRLGGLSNYTLPVATTSIGGIKSGTDITVDVSGNVSVNNDSHNHTISTITGLQTALDNKVDDGQVLTNVPSGALFTDTTYSVFTSTTNGLTPLSGGGTTKYLRSDGTWTTPSGGGSTVSTSTINGNILIDSVEKIVYTHPTGTNPHGTTKTDVGLGNVDNTSDLNKNVLSATKLATPRTINGISFDGTANITISSSFSAPTIYAPTLLNSWVNSNVLYSAVGYYKTTEGIVYLQGLIKGGLTTDPTKIFTLPAGYIPTTSKVLQGQANNGTTTSSCYIEVSTNGGVYIGPNAKNTWLSLDGICFNLS